MREIKFRAWDKGRKKMWYPDSKTVDKNGIYFSFFNGGIGWGVYDEKLGNRVVTGDPKAIFNTPAVIMQFIGIENGNELWEGDIIKQRIYTSNGYEDTLHVLEITGSKFYPTGEDFEVIGNIHENPELLK